MWVYTQVNLDSKSGDGEKCFSSSDFLLFVLRCHSHHGICNGAEFMKMKADLAVQPGHHVARCKTCFGEGSRDGGYLCI